MAWPREGMASSDPEDLATDEVPLDMDEELYKQLVKKRNELARIRNNAPGLYDFPQHRAQKTRHSKNR